MHFLVKSYITPKKNGKITQLGEYFIQGEEVAAFYFSMNKMNKEINYSEVIITLYSPEAKTVHYQKLNLDKNITLLETPIILKAGVSVTPLVVCLSEPIWGERNLAKGDNS